MAATQPSKEQVRVFMERRRVARTPPPEPAEIRRQLGWNMLYNIEQGAKDCAR